MDEYEGETFFVGARWTDGAWAWDDGSTEGLDLLELL